ncbi:MAG TPA: PilZ domain-containing protein [Usitatibacteraceae bacterium]|nr:PilZ domain-containing protein [Usitatibacteraceae bacterium]
MGVTRGMPSDAEIGVLEALAADGQTIASAPGSCTPPFRARLRFVDPGRGFLVLESSGDKAADAAFLARPRTELLVEWGEWRIAFAGEEPHAASHEGVAAIRIRFPESVSISRRRMFERAPVPERAPLHCVAYSGASVIMDATITDMSQGGIGLQVESAGDALQPGMVLLGCRIESPGREPVVVHLEVRHTATTRLPDGSHTVRAGCRFTNLSPRATAFVTEYLSATAQGV